MLKDVEKGKVAEKRHGNVLGILQSMIQFKLSLRGDDQRCRDCDIQKTYHKNRNVGKGRLNRNSSNT